MLAPTELYLNGPCVGAGETDDSTAGIPDVPLLPALPCLGHAPGDLRCRGVHPRARLCI